MRNWQKLASLAVVLSCMPLAPARPQESPHALPPGETGAQGNPQPAEAWGDFDRDGRIDLYVVSPAGEDRLLRNRGDGAFEDVTARAGLFGLGGSRRALWRDFDRDGHLDLYVMGTRGGSRLLRNLGQGSFMDVTLPSGVAHPGEDRTASWMDYDQDEWPDLWIVVGEHTLLYHNNRAGGFEGVYLGLASSPPGAATSGVPDAPIPSGPPPDAGGRPAPRPSPPRPAPATPPPGGPDQPPPGRTAVIVCADQLRDQATGGCGIQASTNPMLGMLYPLSQNLFVSPAGDVGIGTTSPTLKLDVRGEANFVRSVRVNDGGSALPPVVLLTNVPANAIFSLEAGVVSGFSIRDQVANAQRMVISPSGSVGIATTNPSYALHVDGDAGVGSNRKLIARYDSTEAHKGTMAWDSLQLGNNGDNYIIAGRTAAGGSLHFVTNNTNEYSRGAGAPNGTTVMILDSNGRVGIGSTAPRKRLEVLESLRVARPNDPLTYIDLYGGDSATDPFIGSTYSLALEVDGTRRFYISGSGNVGIGTTSPGEKLTVAGVVHSTSGGVRFPDGTLQTTAATGGPTSAITSINGATGPAVSVVGSGGVSVSTSGNTITISTQVSICTYSGRPYTTGAVCMVGSQVSCSCTGGPPQVCHCPSCTGGNYIVTCQANGSFSAPTLSCMTAPLCGQ